MFKLISIFGHVELRETMRAENGKLILGGRAISYDQYGCVVSDTQEDYAIISFVKG